MNASYDDIKKRIKEEPLWYDTHGVPRYDKFHPDLCPNIYADEVILLEIECQRCGKKFFVEANWAALTFDITGKRIPSIKKRMMQWKRNGKKSDGWSALHWGDPPFHGCVGDTMNCFDLRIVEFWKRRKLPSFEWTRRRAFECKIDESR